MDDIVMDYWAKLLDFQGPIFEIIGISVSVENSAKFPCTRGAVKETEARGAVPF